MENKKRLPIIGISTGDINGIGPEVIMKTLLDPRLESVCVPVIYGSGRVLTRYRKLLNLLKFNFNQVNSIKDIHPKRINVINCTSDDIDVYPGTSTAEAGKLAFDSLEAATKDLLHKSIDGLVTAPINKKNIQNENFQFPGHTEYLAMNAGSDDYLMMFYSEDMKIGMVTGHIPLHKVSETLTEDLIISKALMFNNVLKKDFDIHRPKIAILGLNPHAGDNGLLGSEEQETIIPAINKLKEQNVLAFGPYPPDGFFGNYSFKKFDGILALYHDQGLIPFKTIAFEKGVNYTSGLPFIRTSPDHGTAYEIAGKGVANIDSFREALYLAVDIANRRNRALEEK